MITAPRTHKIPIPQWAIDLTLMAVVGVFFALLGPFGSNADPLAARMAYWVLIMPAGGVCVIACEAILRRLLPRPLPWVASFLVVAVLAALPQTGAVLLGERLIFGHGFEAEITLGGKLIIIARLYGSVLVVMLAMVPLIRLVRAQLERVVDATTPASPQAPPETPGQKPPLMARLPRHLQHARLIALEAEDHYVRVHTEAGHELLLIRLADAVREAAPEPGFKTHRSWWVARHAIAGASFKRGSGAVQLSTGGKAPVSRSGVPALRAAGLLPAVKTRGTGSQDPGAPSDV